MFALNNALAHIKCHLERNPKQPLISSQAWLKIHQLVEHIPKTRWTYSCFECRLAPRQSQVDFMLAIGAQQGRAQAASALHNDPTLIEWLGYQTFLSPWSKSTPALAHCPGIGFEWDLPIDKPMNYPHAKPLAAICLNPTIYQSKYHVANRTDVSQLLGCALPLLMPEDDIKLILPTMLKCLNSLPDDGDLLHIMPLQARGLSQCMLLLFIPQSKLLSWLHHIGWQGNLQQVKTLLTASDASRNRISVQLHVGEQIQPYIAIENRLSFGGRLLNNVASLKASLSQISTIDDDKFTALTQWPCQYNLPVDDDSSTQITQDCYVKLVVADKHQPIKAKGYLEVNASMS